MPSMTPTILAWKWREEERLGPGGGEAPPPLMLGVGRPRRSCDSDGQVTATVERWVVREKEKGDDDG